MKTNPLHLSTTQPKDMRILALSAQNVVTDLPFKLDFDIWLVVKAGIVSIATDIAAVDIGPNTFSVFARGRIIEVSKVTEDFKADAFLLSGNFLKSLDINEMLPLKMRFDANPVVALNQDLMEALEDYRRTANRIIGLEGNPYQWESLMYLTRALYLGSGFSLFHKESFTETEDSVLTRFLNLVKTHATREHSTQFYADQLCLTPKYLSKLIKQKTGKTAKAIINAHVLLQARSMLGNTNMSIQQISNVLGFPSQSVFGKFFKQATGLSPKTYKDAHSA